VQLVEPEGEEPFKAKADALLGIDLRIEPSARHYQFAVLKQPVGPPQSRDHDSNGRTRTSARITATS
jgi:hypothetical protein